LRFSIESQTETFSLSLEDSIYTTTNIDDIIDSMARRHLAHRRHNVSLFSLKKKQQKVHYSAWYRSSTTQ